MSLLLLFAGASSGGVVVAPPNSAWDTSDADPFFYDWWRKKQEEVLSPFAEEIAEQAAPAVVEVVKQIGDVQTFTQLEDRTSAVRADLLGIVRDLRAEFLKMKQEEEDDVETLLLLL